MVPATALSPERLAELRQRPADVPCDGCTACCRHDRVVLGPEDDPFAYRWHVEGGYAVLDRQADGSCVHLGPQGCTVHDQPPKICRRFDCRVLVASTAPAQRVVRIALNPNMAQVYAAGDQRLHTLEA